VRLPGTTPAAPDDTGAADPALMAALADGSPAALGTALLTARLLVPVVALPMAGDAEMAVPSLVAADGRRALPVFSSYDALRAWQPDARPVPMSGVRAVAGAAAEGYDALVIDVAGPVTQTISGDELATLAAAAAALAAHPEATVQLLPPDPP
jgi:hypothetical protein